MNYYRPYYNILATVNKLSIKGVLLEPTAIVLQLTRTDLFYENLVFRKTIALFSRIGKLFNKAFL